LKREQEKKEQESALGFEEVIRRRNVEFENEKIEFIESKKKKNSKKILECMALREGFLQKKEKMVAFLDRANKELITPGFDIEETKKDIEEVEKRLKSVETTLSRNDKEQAEIEQQIASGKEITEKMLIKFHEEWEQFHPMPVAEFVPLIPFAEEFQEVLVKKRLEALAIQKEFPEMQSDFRCGDLENKVQYEWAKQFMDLPGLDKPKPMSSFKALCDASEKICNEWSKKRKQQKQQKCHLMSRNQ